MASKSFWSRFPPITLFAVTRDRGHHQDDELYAADEGAFRPWQDQHQISPAAGSGREQAVRRAPGGHCRGALAKGDMVMITAEDLTFLRRAIGIAATAATTGDDPYGSLLVGPQGEILI